MDRRCFLKTLGIGGALIAAAPALVVLPARNLMAAPERRVFLPPAVGWPTWGDEKSALDHLLRVEGGTTIIYGGRHWTVEITKPLDSVVPVFEGAITLGQKAAWLQSYVADYVGGFVHERYIGLGEPPTLADLPKHLRASISVDRPRQTLTLV